MELQRVIDEFTKLHENKHFESAHRLLCDTIRTQGVVDADLYWRLALVCRDLALNLGKKDRTLFKKYVTEGLEAAETGLKYNPDHPKCHCWLAIHLNYLSQLEGINKRIENSFKMKNHWLKAIQVNPEDAVTLHALGRWCFEVADLPFLKRKFAQTFFTTPPTSTFEEGLEYLLASEKVAPRLIANNSLYLAKTYQRLKKYDLARESCENVLRFTATDMDTETAKEEAASILKKLPS